MCIFIYKEGRTINYSDVTKTIIRLSGEATLTFAERASQLQEMLKKSSRGEILAHLYNAGVIPECFSHDSTEEKLYAKYCDALLAVAWDILGLSASLIIRRAGAADVSAKSDSYSIVGDAKAFRLSRTAKNQKDFKLDALDRWREGADYACLVAPLYQYPKSRSQIYQQAVQKNVTLLSYTHLAYLIRHVNAVEPSRLQELWKIGSTLAASTDAEAYWSEVNDLVCSVTSTGHEQWQKAVQETYDCLERQAQDQIKYWQGVKEHISALTRDEAVSNLIAILNIDSKIAEIQKSTSKLGTTKAIAES